MKLHRGFLPLVGLIAVGDCAAAQGSAVSALAGKADLTPENLIRSFAGFTFELSAQPQAAETFLQRKRGDCDDFASLAGRLLTARGYQTKLVAVMLERQTHVVCYVREAHGYLDFNHRSNAQPIIACDGSLEDIAQKVARDFRSQWQTASEFRYNGTSPVYLEIVFPPAAASNRDVATVAPRGRIRHGTKDVVSPLPISAAPISLETSARPETTGSPGGIANEQNSGTHPGEMPGK